MNTDITIGQMYPANSLVHRLEPRVKIIFTIVFVVMLFVSSSPFSLALCLAFMLLCYALSKIPFKMLIKTLKPVVPIVLFMLVFNMFFYNGETVLFKAWILKLTREGIETAVFMVFRIVILIAGTSLLTYTTSSIQLTDAIESLLSPLKIFKFPVHDLAMMMTIALRFIPTLIDETQKIMSAQKSRGADFESGNLMRRVKALLPILIPLFISAVKRATELATAMESRCYNNGIGRTKMKKLKIAPRDCVSAVVVAAVLAGVIVLNIFTTNII